MVKVNSGMLKIGISSDAIGAISHSGAHAKNAIRWLEWLLRNLSNTAEPHGLEIRKHRRQPSRKLPSGQAVPGRFDTVLVNNGTGGLARVSGKIRVV
jgi:hypothetical protein